MRKQWIGLAVFGAVLLSACADTAPVSSTDAPSVSTTAQQTTTVSSSTTTTTVSTASITSKSTTKTISQPYGWRWPMEVALDFGKGNVFYVASDNGVTVTDRAGNKIGAFPFRAQVTVVDPPADEPRVCVSNGKKTGYVSMYYLWPYKPTDEEKHKIPYITKREIKTLLEAKHNDMAALYNRLCAAGRILKEETATISLPDGGKAVGFAASGIRSADDLRTYLAATYTADFVETYFFAPNAPCGNYFMMDGRPYFCLPPDDFTAVWGDHYFVAELGSGRFFGCMIEKKPGYPAFADFQKVPKVEYNAWLADHSDFAAMAYENGYKIAAVIHKK